MTIARRGGQLTISICLVDLCILWKFAVGFERAGFVGGVLEDDVALLILVVAEREKDDISLINPNLCLLSAHDLTCLTQKGCFKE